MEKEELCQYRWLWQEIEQLQSDKTAMLARLSSTSVLDGTAHGQRNRDAIGEIVGKREQLQRQMEEKIQALLILRQKIEAAIDSLAPEDRILIRMRYVDGLTWEQIAERMNYSWRQVHRRHSKALVKLAEMS